MNQAQKKVAIAFAALCVVMALFPPWTQTVVETAGGLIPHVGSAGGSTNIPKQPFSSTIEYSASYQFLFDPPANATWNRNGDSFKSSFRVDAPMLAIQFVLALVIAATAVMLLGGRNASRRRITEGRATSGRRCLTQPCEAAADVRVRSRTLY